MNYSCLISKDTSPLILIGRIRLDFSQANLASRLFLILNPDGLCRALQYHHYSTAGTVHAGPNWPVLGPTPP